MNYPESRYNRVQRKGIQISMSKIPEIKRNKSGHTLPGSCPKNGKNTLNLPEQGSRRHCSNFMCLHLINQAHVLLRHIHMCMLDNLTYPEGNSMMVHYTPRLSNCHKKVGASRMTVPGPTKVLPDGSDWAQKPVPFRVANILCKSRIGEVRLINHLGIESLLENLGLPRKS
ncbi:hypothetical protein E2C01_035978 [Portunus trituberculatus]|uniref:Uncharacterized protein n=1 Tax=Portunus trituberculatus TaxID=210409 RepID=A0A5B7F9Y3_PORTR|nr:hypothetical protein [Portunus trituberculatus]